jgi:hypothetical protein
VIYATTTHVWDGGGQNSLWTTPENWVDDVAPLPGDDLVFPAGALQPENVNDYDPATIFGAISVLGEDYHILNGISSSATIEITAGTLETSSIICDSLVIGAPAGRYRNATAVSNSVLTASDTSASVENAPVGPAGLTIRNAAPAAADCAISGDTGESRSFAASVTIATSIDTAAIIETLSKPEIHNASPIDAADSAPILATFPSSGSATAMFPSPHVSDHGLKTGHFERTGMPVGTRLPVWAALTNPSSWTARAVVPKATSSSQDSDPPSERLSIARDWLDNSAYEGAISALVKANVGSPAARDNVRILAFQSLFTEFDGDLSTVQTHRRVPAGSDPADPTGIAAITIDDFLSCLSDRA